MVGWAVYEAETSFKLELDGKARLSEMFWRKDRELCAIQ